MSHYQIEENFKIMQSPFIKSLSFSYGNGFFFKRHYYAFIANQMLKNTFFEWICKQKL
jgi:hypothetical protein